MALAAAAAGAGVAGAQLPGSVGDEAPQDAVFDQHGALGFHALVVHAKGAEGSIGEALVDGGHRLMGNGFTHFLGKRGGAPLHLGGFQQVPAGLVEDHTAEAVRQHHRQLARLHVVGVEHGAGALAHLLGAGFGIPLAQVVRPAGGAVTPAHAGAVVAIGGEHV